MFGVFGYIQLATYSYLVLIEEASMVGQVLKANILRVEKLMFLPLTNDSSRMVAKEDQPFVDMINTIQRERSFYFSYDIDLTKNMQTILKETQDLSEKLSQPTLYLDHQNQFLMKQTFPNSIGYLPQYAFNENLMTEMSGAEYAPFKVPCIFGYVFICSPNLNKQNLDFYLISRKDCRRPGRRFVTRGLDRQGNAANFVETEHIFVQF